MVNRSVVATAATAVTSLALLIGAAAPAPALNNAPVATSAEAEAIIQVFATFGPGDGGTCTGAVVSPTQVVTARHCITGAESVRISGHGTAGRINVADYVQDNATGNDVALLTLAEPWTGPTLPMSIERVNQGTTLDFYGMGDTGTLHTASGRVTSYGTVSGKYLNRGRGGDVMIARLGSGATAESGDSGGPIIKDGQVVGVIQSITTRDASLVLGAPLSTSSQFILAHTLSAGAREKTSSPRFTLTQPVSERVAGDSLPDSPVPAEAPTSSTPTTETLGTVIAVLLALGIGVHAGALMLPGV